MKSTRQGSKGRWDIYMRSTPILEITDRYIQTSNSFVHPEQ